MSVVAFCNEPRLVLESFGTLFVGEQIGSGAYRRVYAHADGENVVKVEYQGIEFCNVAEMRVWQEVQDTQIADWFAPCSYISEIGVILIQRRTLPFRNEIEFTTALMETRDTPEVPSFFDDVHFGNFGMLDGRVVCHDYGFNHFLALGVKSAREKREGRLAKLKKVFLP